MEIRKGLALAALLPFLGHSAQWCDPGDSPDPGGVEGCPSCWRSWLYPADWSPESTDEEGNFLHDFSYAGYRNGEVEPPDQVPGPLVSVLDHGADPAGRRDSTAAIQAAIDEVSVAGGGTVLLPEGTYRCDGVLTVTRSGVLLKGAGADHSRIYFTRHEGMTGRSHVEFRGALRSGLEVALAQDGLNRSDIVYVDDSEGLEAGQDVTLGWTISDAFVDEHGMDGTWQAFNGQWKAFFRRSIVDIDRSVRPHAVQLDVPLRYRAKVRDGASLKVETGHLSECGIEDLGLANSVDAADAWENDRAHVLAFRSVKDCWVRGLASFAPPGREDHLQSGGLYLLDSKRVTVSYTRMEKAQHRGGGGNGYLFEVSRCNEVLIRDCVGRKGRHNFIQNWDFGTSGCVFLRTESSGGRAFQGRWDPIGTKGCSEFHHSLAMANLIDDSSVEDCWSAVNRHDWSSGAGLTATQSVFWRLRGGGDLDSYQAGMGYVIGTDDVNVHTSLSRIDPISNRDEHSEPEDYTEGLDDGDTLRPRSLYDDQLRLRLAR